MNACQQTHCSLGNNFLTLASPRFGLELVLRRSLFNPLLMCVALVTISLGVKHLWLNTAVRSVRCCHLVLVTLPPSCLGCDPMYTLGQERLSCCLAM